MRTETTYVQEIDLELFEDKPKKVLTNIFIKLRQREVPISLEFNRENGRFELFACRKSDIDLIKKLAKDIKQEYKRLDLLSQDLIMLGVEL